MNLKLETKVANEAGARRPRLWKNSVTCEVVTFLTVLGNASPVDGQEEQRRLQTVVMRERGVKAFNLIRKI